MKSILAIVILTIGLMTITHAQGITNTLGGNTSAEKFIIENSDSEASLVITGEGNVGIGTSSPISKLHIYDDVNSSLSLRIQNANTGTGASTKLYFDGSNYAGIAVFGSSHSSSANVMRIFNNRNSPDGSIDFVVNGGKKMVIDNTGNVGIGTSNPGANLDANGDVILGENGSRFLEIREFTGITAYGVTDISLPSGYTEDNTRVLSLEIFSEFVGGWAGLGDDSAPGAYSFNDDNISYVLHDDMISIQHPKKVEWWEKPFRIIMMKMP